MGGMSRHDCVMKSVWVESKHLISFFNENVIQQLQINNN